jgi:cytochrome c peroxidase
MSMWHRVDRWYTILSVVLVCLTCAGWIWLLVDGEKSSAPTNVMPPALAETLQEPITPVPKAPAADPRKVALGHALFADPRLFDAGGLSCMSCHDLQTNGASANRVDRVPGGSLPDNTPTVFNVGLDFRLDWAGDLPTLEDQVVSALRAHRTLSNTPEQAAARINQDPALHAQFAKIYGHRADRTSLIDSIATFERSLTTPGSRFDRWLEGDKSALTAAEQRGYREFQSLGCIDCHQGVNVGGNLYERSGVFHPLTPSGSILLRVPSLRNVATTPPYFHDGGAPTLDEAVRRMASAQLNRTLTDDEDHAIVSFLNTLTGQYNGAPVRNPKP